METNHALDPLDDTERLIGRNLRRIRESLGLKQQDVAERAGAFGFKFHQTQVAKIERGERPVRVNEWIALAEALGVQPDALMAGGLGTDEKLFEARLLYERSRMALDDAGTLLFKAEQEYEKSWQNYRDARDMYWDTAAEFGVEPESPAHMIAEEATERLAEMALSSEKIPVSIPVVLQAFGNYMELIRLRAGLTHSELSKKTAIPETVIRDLEKGYLMKVGDGYARIRSVVRMLAARCNADAYAVVDMFDDLVSHLPLDKKAGEEANHNA